MCCNSHLFIISDLNYFLKIFSNLLLAKDPALERFKSYRKSASSIRRVGDYLTIAVVAGCCYEIYVRAVTREEARKALKSK
ncbi:putative succinate dehydrogenase subunit 7 [Helianthus annuus]|nr:putative succinate dehydrogenase subunit 7 [Helianthus annuus]